MKKLMLLSVLITSSLLQAQVKVKDLSKEVISLLHEQCKFPLPLIKLILDYSQKSIILDIQKDAHITLDTFAKDRCYSGRHSISWSLMKVPWDYLKKTLRFPVAALTLTKYFLTKLPRLTVRLFNQREYNYPPEGSAMCIMHYELDENNNFILLSKSRDSYPLGTAAVHTPKAGYPWILKGDIGLGLPTQMPCARYSDDNNHITARVIDHDPNIGGTKVEVCFDDENIQHLRQALEKLKAKEDQSKEELPKKIGNAAADA